MTRWRQGDAPMLAGLTPELASLFEADVGASFGIRRTGDVLAPDFLFYVGLPDSYRTLHNGAAKIAPVRYGAYDPGRPEPEQRNRVMTRADLMPEFTQAWSYGVMWKKYGFLGADQLRVLVCDGPALLAYVGVVRRAPFCQRDRRLLESLVRPMLTRLKWEARLNRGQLARAGLEAALHSIAAPALIVRANGAIAHTNPAGGAWVERNRIRRVPPNRADTRTACDVISLTGAGLPTHYLLIYRGAAASRCAHVGHRAAEWALTARQRQVLDLLAQGDRNRAIATKLGCRQRTVESHVSAILAKAGCDSRAEIATLLWADR